MKNLIPAGGAAIELPVRIQPEGYFTDNAVRKGLAVLYMDFKIFNIDRVNIVNRFGNFSNTVFNGIIKAFFRGGNDLNYFYNRHKVISLYQKVAKLRCRMKNSFRQCGSRA